MSTILIIQRVKAEIKTRMSADWTEGIPKGDFSLLYKKLSYFS